MNSSEEALKRFQIELENRSMAQVAGESVVYSIMMFLAVAGNGFMLFVILKTKRFRTATNYCIACFAVSDIIMGIFNEPLFLSALIVSKWPFNSALCQNEGYIAVSMSCVSIQTLAWTAFSRYLKVVKSSNWFTPRRLVVCMSFTWITCLLSPVPYLASGQRFIFHPAKFFCYLTLDKIWFTVLLISIYVVLPTIAIVICYSKVFIKIYKHSFRQERCRNNSAMNVEEIKVTRSLFIMVFVFMLCWTPVIIIDLIDTVRGTWSLTREAYAAYSFLATLSTCVNPFIYGLTNPRIKREYNNVWRNITIGRHNNVMANNQEREEMQAGKGVSLPVIAS